MFVTGFIHLAIFHRLGLPDRQTSPTAKLAVNYEMHFAVLALTNDMEVRSFRQALTPDWISGCSFPSDVFYPRRTPKFAPVESHRAESISRTPQILIFEDTLSRLAARVANLPLNYSGIFLDLWEPSGLTYFCYVLPIPLPEELATLCSSLLWFSTCISEWHCVAEQRESWCIAERSEFKVRNLSLKFRRLEHIDSRCCSMLRLTVNALEWYRVGL